jgi:hypothetical protein
LIHIDDLENNSSRDAILRTPEGKEYRIYSPEESYEIGETIFHEEWQEYGKVKAKEITSSGHSAIVVDFEKSGEKKLLENFKQ